MRSVRSSPATAISMFFSLQPEWRQGCQDVRPGLCSEEARTRPKLRLHQTRLSSCEFHLISSLTSVDASSHWSTLDKVTAVFICFCCPDGLRDPLSLSHVNLKHPPKLRRRSTVAEFASRASATASAVTPKHQFHVIKVDFTRDEGILQIEPSSRGNC